MGSGAGDQQMPRPRIGVPPSSAMIPPAIAVEWVTLEAGWVEIAGTVSALVVKERSSP